MSLKIGRGGGCNMLPETHVSLVTVSIEEQFFYAESESSSRSTAGTMARRCQVKAGTHLYGASVLYNRGMEGARILQCKSKVGHVGSHICEN